MNVFHKRCELMLFIWAWLFFSANLTQAADVLQAVCVPAQSSDLTISHQTYDGAEITLKGIARGNATEYMWLFGDGTPDTEWMTITDPYNLGIKHTYSGVVGKKFQATLKVRNAGGQLAQDIYPVQIYESSDLTNRQHLDVRVNMAVDEGLWWLHTNMVRNDYANDAPGYGQPYGEWADSKYRYPLASTCVAVDAFQLHGSKVNADYGRDPYVETVQRGLNYLLGNTYSFPIGPQTAGNPDTNGNGIGVVANHSSSITDTRQTYIGGICMVTLASSGAPNRIAEVGRDYVHGRPYKDIVQDMADFFAWGQVDANRGASRGGWRYYANYSGSDMSTAQWPPLGMLAAEENMGTIIPKFVRDEVLLYLDAMQRRTKDNDNGAFAYAPGTNWYNITKAAAGIIVHEFVGTPLTDPRIQEAIGYIYRHWGDVGNGWDDTKLHGNSYGMYGTMKAFRIPEPDIHSVMEYDYNAENRTGKSFDWYYNYTPAEQTQEGLASYLVRTQQADGSWDDSVGDNPVYDAFATGWDILTLLPGVTTNPPRAVICACEEQEYNLNQDVKLDGTCSFHPNRNRSIVSYAWDLDNDGTFDDAAGTKASILGGFPQTGLYPVALKVTDDNPANLGGPQSSTFVCQVNAHPPPHCPHSFSGGPYFGGVNVPVKLDASISWDPDNEIASYEWDLDNDGLFGTDDKDTFGQPSDAVGIKPEWTWDAPYTGIIGLKVTDVEGEFPVCSDTSFTEIEIGNQAPQSVPGGPYSTFPGATITLDGTGSFDPDPGDEISYAWDLDNDGEFDDSSIATPEFTVANDAETGHTYDVCLKVTDSFGKYGLKCTSIVISEVHIWLYPDALTGATNRSITLDLRAKTGENKVGGLDLNLAFNPTILQVDESEFIGGLEPGDDWPADIVANADNETGSIKFAGATSKSTVTGDNLQLGIIHFKSTSTTGSTLVELSINDFIDENEASMGAIVRGNSVVTIRKVLCGDANSDGKVTVKDALAILKYLVKKPTVIDLLAAGVRVPANGISVADALAILKYIVKKPVPNTCFVVD